MKEKKHLEFSKKIFYMLSAMIAILCIYSMALMWHTGDTSGLAYLLTGAFGAFSVGVGFYYDKAKKENIQRIKNQKSADKQYKNRQRERPMPIFCHFLV